MSRELRERARTRIQPDTDDESDDADDEESPAQIPASSIQDLVNPADAQQFDQTFSDADANLDIEGAFDPVAGDKQVIPRIAFVLNFNLVYNEQQERWEPDTGNEEGGGALQSTTLEKTSGQSLPVNNQPTTVTFQQTETDTLSGADLANNQITVPATGEYLLTGTILYTDIDDGADLDTRVQVNSSLETFNSSVAPQNSSGEGLSRALSKVSALTAGDTVTLTAAAASTSSATVGGAPAFTHLSAVQLS